MNRVLRITLISTVVAALGFGVAACEDSTQDKETKAKLRAYERVVANQPLESPTHSTTRETINKWVRTWGGPKSKGKLSYVYIQNAKGEYGYYILKGLPVSYCKMGTPPSQGVSKNNSAVSEPLPGMDGTYTDGAGACNTYYGFDATTDAYLEFSVGMNQSFFLYDQPMPLAQFKDAQQMGPTSVADAKKKSGD